MARRPRIQFPGALYHVMSRGNRKGAIFADDEDQRAFLAVVNAASHRYAIRCYAWCLIINHYHLVIDTPRGNLSDAMRHINGVFTQRSNRRHRRTGHLFEGRFRSLVVQRESYLRRVTRYVVLNPVRAGIVRDASAWPWSSYRATAGLDQPPEFLYLDWLDRSFPGASREESQRRYRLFVNDPLTKRAKLDLGALAVGDPEFLAGVREVTLAAHPDMLLPGAIRAISRPSLTALFATTNSREQRNHQIYVAHVEHGYRLAEVAAFLGLHPSSATLAVRRFEAAKLAKSAQFS